VQACQKTCYQRHVIKRCGCFDAYYPADNASAFNYVTVPVCSIKNITQGALLSLSHLNYLVWVQLTLTPPKVNWFGLNPEHYEYIVGGWPRRNFVFFCQVSNARFHRFPVGQISRNLNTTRRSVSRWKPLEHNFKTFTVRCRFSKKCKNFSKKLPSGDFWSPQLHNDYRSPEIRYQTNSLKNFSFLFQALESNHSHFPGRYTPYKISPQISCDVRRALTTRQITMLSVVGSQSPSTIESCDTKPRLMQEVNSLCTDSPDLRAEYCIVGIPHNTSIWFTHNTLTF